ncbi:MAG: zinc-binding dehydrogenase [Acidimicrobiia bacterium]|nr:zinc-binding dehydrogenase [Acidimicrobiia bacterium]MYE72581.1 zinc-binding dehydrogenase [Acidimicrobiia bacterium]MYJ61308.1 zinc-binding dehydrogenase [Acidimicrobiia bacterium]
MSDGEIHLVEYSDASVAAREPVYGHCRGQGCVAADTDHCLLTHFRPPSNSRPPLDWPESSRGRPLGGLLGREVDGLFADYAAIDERQLLAVPNHVSSDALGVVQVLGTCVHAVSKAPVSPGDTAVVLGLGVSGQLIAQLLAAQGAHVIGVTRSEWKRELVLQHGAAAAVTPEQAAEVVAELTEGRGPEAVFEAVGTVQTFSQAIELAGPAATVVFFGTTTGMESGLPYYQLYYKELSLRNPRGATMADYEKAIALVADGVINGVPLISSRFGLDEIDEALAATRDSSTLKVLMEVE